MKRLMIITLVSFVSLSASASSFKIYKTKATKLAAAFVEAGARPKSPAKRSSISVSGVRCETVDGNGKKYICSFYDRIADKHWDYSKHNAAHLALSSKLTAALKAAGLKPIRTTRGGAPLTKLVAESISCFSTEESHNSCFVVSTIDYEFEYDKYEPEYNN